MTQRIFLVTGAASGINAAVADRLRGQGNRVIGVDLHSCEISADLATAGGREHMIAEATRIAPGGLDGVIAGAGTTGAGQPEMAVRVNYFGAVATLEGLHPLLAKSSRPRAVALISTAALHAAAPAIVSACLSGNEDLAVAIGLADPKGVYGASKQALARWVRRMAVTPKWAGAGIALNGIAPGGVKTPMLADAMKRDGFQAVMTSTTPKAVADYACPDDLAEPICWLATAETGYLLGQVLYVDGGTDALLRGDHI